MDLNTLETLLQAEGLGLRKDGNAYCSSDEEGISVFAASGGELMRFTKITKVVLEPGLLAAELIALERESAFTVLEIRNVFAVERDTAKSKEKRRTGFS